MATHLKYLSCFFFPVSVVCFLYSGPHSATDAFLWTFLLWFLILLDWLSPEIQPQQKKKFVSDWYYDVILYLLSFLQFLIISLLIIYASQLQWNTVNEVFISIVNLIVLRILVGTTSGSSAIIVAHELIHRPQLHMQIIGKLLLYTVCYEHFIIAHMRGHHYTVATPEDMATARLGESFETYWKRVFAGHFKYAWNSELERLDLNHLPLYHYKMLTNSVLQGILVELTVLIMILVFFGWTAVFIFLYQALSGVRLLETINYYQHWGLGQGKDGNTLAWVNQSCVTEYALIGLSNHIGHHQNSASLFYQIPFSLEGPKMPYGYFVTNLWVKLNNKSYRQVCEKILKDYFKREAVD